MDPPAKSLTPVSATFWLAPVRLKDTQLILSSLFHLPVPVKPDSSSLSKDDCIYLPALGESTLMQPPTVV
ncbi:hypothetical protein CDL15_Pgr011584 [Punica granatum]|uniref:Uncharacterized protein n=1 Tax=Punica granatum TaxID=22663 RepID=A0A218Y0S4_PUNGR|nr:hypothetical protein CDL15_Pgr011584 [Punica granatum]